MDTILVTGGAGYIGLHLVLALEKAGYSVVVLDNLSTGQTHAILKGKLVKGDVGNQKVLSNIFKTHRITTIMHLAALTNVSDSINTPLKYYENNVCQTLTLLEQAVKHRVKYFIFASSAAIFSHTTCTPINEKHIKHPITPYGKAKWLIEGILKDCYTAYDLNSIIFRYFNVAGAHPTIDLIDPKKKWTQLIPLVLQAAKGTQKHIKIFGDQYKTPDGTCLRDYVHVSDICHAHLLVMKNLSTFDGCLTYNLGTGNGCSVKQVIKAAEKVTQKTIPSTISMARVGDSPCVIADNSLARSALTWSPKSSQLEMIIKTFWKWLK
jgi:UDP-glucose 4-epimerase